MVDLELCRKLWMKATPSLVRNSVGARSLTVTEWAFGFEATGMNSSLHTNLKTYGIWGMRKGQEMVKACIMFLHRNSSLK